MLSKETRPEIDHHTFRLIIGAIALLLALITTLLTQGRIESISASYHEDGAARNIFVGFLFAIAGFLLAYNGRTGRELVLSKIAALAAIGVALFPCDCGLGLAVVPRVHGISAGIMFLILAIFCAGFYRRASKKSRTQAQVRAVVYAACFITIVAALGVLGVDQATGGGISERFSRITFYGEAAALVAFGVAWLTASRILPWITHPKERLSFSPFATHALNESEAATETT